MPVCIVGMHRSGTSLVTRIVQECGLYLGPDRDLAPPAPDNPDGFWENVRVVDINEALLDGVGGGWDAPPASADLPASDALYAAAAALVDEFRACEPWGWKDPRTALTLPFWLRVVPDLRFVVCLRKPIEVALSLRRRNFSSRSLGINLWRAYNERILALTPPERRIVTHYDAYFSDPKREIRRVLAFLGLPPDEEAVSRGAALVSPDLRHQRFTVQDLHDVELDGATFDLYDTLCAEAGSSCESVASARPSDQRACQPQEPPASSTRDATVEPGGDLGEAPVAISHDYESEYEVQPAEPADDASVGHFNRWMLETRLAAEAVEHLRGQLAQRDETEAALRAELQVARAEAEAAVHAARAEAALQAVRTEAEAYRQTIGEQTVHLDQLRARITTLLDREADLQDRNAIAQQQFSQQLAERNAEVQRLSGIVRKRDERLALTQRSLDEAQRDLKSFRNSRYWRLRQRLRRLLKG